MTTSLTSITMCIFCHKMWPANQIFEKIFANLLAGPVVLTIITPATISIIFGQLLNFQTVVDVAVLFLECGLKIFLDIAETFGKSPPQGSFFRTAQFVRPGVDYEWFNHPYLFLIFLNMFLMLIILELKSARSRDLITNQQIRRG